MQNSKLKSQNYNLKLKTIFLFSFILMVLAGLFFLFSNRTVAQTTPPTVICTGTKGVNEGRLCYDTKTGSVWINECSTGYAPKITRDSPTSFGGRCERVETQPNPLGTIQPPPGVAQYGSGIPGFSKFIQNIVNLIFSVAFLIAFVMLMIGGIQWMMAGGDEKAVTAARGRVTMAVVGFVIVLSAFTIISFVEIFFGFEILKTGFNIPGP